MFDHLSLFWRSAKFDVEHKCDDVLSLTPCLQPNHDRIQSKRYASLIYLFGIKWKSMKFNSINYISMPLLF
jgi:hypothetical protein